MAVKKEILEAFPVPDSGQQQEFAERRAALLELHKKLLESERASYEAVMGKINSPYHFLQLLTTDPWFAWLHPFSQIIASVDEKLGAKIPATAAEINQVFTEARNLLVPSEIGEGFGRHYFDALQRDPDVVFAHAEAMKLLRAKKN